MAASAPFGTEFEWWPDAVWTRSNVDLRDARLIAERVEDVEGSNTLGVLWWDGVCSGDFGLWSKG